MYRKLTLTIAILAIAYACLIEGKAKKKHRKKPHLIYILGDDIGYNDVGWNNPKMNTPHMNKMAKDGVILDQFYSTPLCTPSRTTLMTGLYPQQSGLQRGVIGDQEPYGVPTKFIFLPKTLKDRANYATHAVGKWHLGYCNWQYTPLNRGFDTFFGFYNGAEENYNHCLSKTYEYNNCTGYDFRRNDKDVHKEFTGEFSTYLYAKRAEQIIEEHPRHKSLFLYVALTDTHFPVQAPARFRKGCEKEVSKVRRTFCASMAAVDEAVKNITRALKRNGLYDDSVIVFTSDNGGSVHFGGNNYPLRGNKGSLWEGGSRVPGFVHSPLLKKRGYVHEGIFHIVDWYPTFMFLAGIKPDRSLNLQGVNQWKAISEGKKSARIDFPYSIDVLNDTLIGAVRKGDYKLIASTAGLPDTVVTEAESTDESFNGTYLVMYTKNFQHLDTSDRAPKLYNLAEDPTEKHNLADSEPEKLNELLNTLRYYIVSAKPAVKMDKDPAGDPDHYNDVFTPGWCEAYYDVPVKPGSDYSNLDIGDLV